MLTPTAIAPALTAPPDGRRFRARVLFTLWLTYGSYYLCRANLSIAVPELEKLPGMDHLTVGWIMTAGLAVYGVGQLVHGLLVDRYGARGLGTIGMLVSAACNVGFGLAGSLPMFIGLWAVNGFAQATGAPMRVKTLGNWVPAAERGRTMALIGTDYVIGNAAAWLLSGWLVGQYGWRSAFIVPGCILVLSALHFVWRVRNHPHDVGLPDPHGEPRSAPQSDGQSAPQSAPHTDSRGREAAPKLAPDMGKVVRQSLLSWRVWVVAIAYFGVDLFRYGFLNWSFAYVSETTGDVGVGSEILKVVMVPAAGALGILWSGWLTDKMGGRRVPVVCGMLLLAAGLAAYLRFGPQHSLVSTLLVLAGIGFFLYGPHLLMGATMAIDLGTPHASGSASGLIDAVGYAGAAVAGVGTAWAREAWGWNGAFFLWIGAALFATALMATLWSLRAHD